MNINHFRKIIEMVERDDPRSPYELVVTLKSGACMEGGWGSINGSYGPLLYVTMMGLGQIYFEVEEISALYVRRLP